MSPQDPITCYQCDGTGTIDIGTDDIPEIITCPTCDGAGWITKDQGDPNSRR